MDFQQTFLNALVTNNLIKTVLIKNHLPKFLSIPAPIVENLPYVNAYQNILASYPYYYELSNLDSYCLIYTESGIGTLIFDNQCYILTSGTLAIVNCLENHRIEINHSPWKYKVFYIQGTSIPFLYNSFIDNYGNLHTLPLASDVPNMLNKLYILLDKSSDNYYLQSKIIIDILLELMIEKNKLENSNIPDYLIKIKNNFDEHYQNCYTLDALELEYHISKFRICHEFTNYFYSSPIQYLNNKRIEIAKDALLHTDKRINEIGRMIGFENTNHFIRIFKQQNGVTPLIFRKHPPSSLI